jgi:hypothetical protein
MLGFANSAQQRQNGFVGRGNCFVASVPTKPSRANTRHFNELRERLKARENHPPAQHQPQRARQPG